MRAMRARTIAIASQKGGVGKTTTAHALAWLLAQRGRRVLMVDLDPQASLTAACNFQAEGASWADVLLGNSELSKILVEVGPGLDLAPSSIDLAYVETVIGRDMTRIPQYLVRDALAGVSRRYDYILMDCPPSLALLTLNGLSAAGEVLVPARPEYLGLRALAHLTKTISDVRRGLNKDLELIGILVTHRRRTKHHDEIIQAWREARLPVLEIQIGETIAAAEAPVAGLSVAEYAKGSLIAEGYSELARWLDG